MNNYTVNVWIWYFQLEELGHQVGYCIREKWVMTGQPRLIKENYKAGHSELSPPG